MDKPMQLQVGRPGIEAMSFADGFDQFFSWHDGETAVNVLEWDISRLTGSAPSLTQVNLSAPTPKPKPDPVACPFRGKVSPVKKLGRNA